MSAAAAAEKKALLGAINNLASLLRAMGGDERLREAEQLLLESLAGKQQLLGPRHPETLIGVNQLGQLYMASRRLDMAEPYFHEALQGRREVLGPRHPQTLNAMGNLADLQRQKGRPRLARRTLGDAVLISTDVLGAAHRVTTALQEKLDAIEKAVAETPEKAEEALARRQNKLGAKSRVVARLVHTAASSRKSAPASLLSAAAATDGDAATGEARRPRRMTILRGGTKGQQQQPSSSQSPQSPLQPPLQSPQPPPPPDLGTQFQQLAAQQRLAAAPVGVGKLKAAGSATALQSRAAGGVVAESTPLARVPSAPSVRGAATRKLSAPLKQALGRPKPASADLPVESRPALVAGLARALRTPGHRAPA